MNDSVVAFDEPTVAVFVAIVAPPPEAVPVTCAILVGSSASPTLTTTPETILDAVRFSVVTAANV